LPHRHRSRSPRAGSPPASSPACSWRSSWRAARPTASPPRRATTDSRLTGGTLAGVFADLSALLVPLAERIGERTAAAAHLPADEARWRVFAAVGGQGLQPPVAVGLPRPLTVDSPDTTVFRIARSRSSAVLAEHLVSTRTPVHYPLCRRLLLSSDFSAVYQALGASEQVDNRWRWSHIRRHFIRADAAHPSMGSWAEAWV
jgi:hypothetical protein